ncbi:MAG: cytochrome c [Betaproteobacteria bacterium]|nr:cytochrome c [Pseudomonadota bacterium]
MNKKMFFAGLAFTLGSVVTANAFAQAKPDVLVKQRQAGMTLIAKYFGPLGGMAAGRVPFNAAVAARNAGYLEVLSKLPWDGFDASTSGEKSAALPAVFSDAGKFKEAGDNFQAAVDKLAAAAKGGNEADIKAAAGAVGKTCGGCHENFRAKS